MVRATSVARRRRRRMWSSRRVWSDVCLVCGGIRKTGSLYVLHAPEALKAESLAPYARIYTYASVRIQGIHSRARARARACVCVYVCHSDTNVPTYPWLCPKLQSRASHHVRYRYTPPRYDLFFPFSQHPDRSQEKVR